MTLKKYAVCLAVLLQVYSLHTSVSLLRMSYQHLPRLSRSIFVDVKQLLLQEKVTQSTLADFAVAFSAASNELLELPEMKLMYFAFQHMVRVAIMRHLEMGRPLNIQEYECDDFFLKNFDATTISSLEYGQKGKRWMNAKMEEHKDALVIFVPVIFPPHIIMLAHLLYESGQKGLTGVDLLQIQRFRKAVLVCVNDFISAVKAIENDKE